jgi:hypothetical protein
MKSDKQVKLQSIEIKEFAGGVQVDFNKAQAPPQVVLSKSTELLKKVRSLYKSSYVKKIRFGTSYFVR